MFMLNLNKVPDDSDSIYMSSSTVVNSSLLHARLGHVHYKRMLEMYKDDLIPASDENHDKCSTCLEKGRYGVSKVFDTAYWGFLGVGTTFDIFHNILFPYGLNKTYWSFLDTAYWILFPSWSLVKCRHRYAVSSLMDMAYCLAAICGPHESLPSLLPPAAIIEPAKDDNTEKEQVFSSMGQKEDNMENELARHYTKNLFA
ncbi:zinc finger, CCHC-type containing protein, partial [Tanacetum coccineum]